MASELRVNTLKDASGNNSVAMQYVAEGTTKAWINMNGTGTIATRDSLNISSITDDGTGDYITTVTSAFNNVNYSIVGNCAPNYGVKFGIGFQIMHRDSSFEQANTTTTQQFQTVDVAETIFDSKHITHNLHGDLA